MKYILLILFFIINIPTAFAADISESCPYGYRNAIVDENASQSNCDSYQNHSSYVATCTSIGEDAYGNERFILTRVVISDCAQNSSDDAAEQGCYPSDVSDDGYCGYETKECETYNGLSFTLEASKSCGDYCAGPDETTNRGIVHLCTDADSDYDRGQSTGDESDGPCAACPDSTDELEYVGRDDGGNSCYTQYLTSEDGTGYSISYMCYDENGDQVTQDGDISFDCETSPQYCDTGTGDGSDGGDSSGDSSDDSDDADSNSGGDNADPDEDSGTGGGDDDSGTDVDVSDEQPEYESNADKVEAVQAEYLEALENLTNQFDDYFDFGSSSGSPFGTDRHTIKGAVVDFGLGRFSGLFDLLPSIIMLFAAAQSAYIILGGSKS